MSEFDVYNAEAAMRTPEVRQLCSDLALALRAAAAKGLSEGICSHMSMAVPNTRCFLLSPRGMMWSEVHSKDIVLVDESGTKLVGHHEVEGVATRMHAAIHRFSGRKCVMHTQMPHATALTMIYGAGFNTMVSQIAMRFHGRVVQNITYNGFATDAAEGERLARAMEGESGKYDVAFLSNHGVIVCGDRIDSTFTDLYHLERACQLQVLAMSTGQPLRPVEDAGMAARVQLACAGADELFFSAQRRALNQRP